MHLALLSHSISHVKTGVTGWIFAAGLDLLNLIPITTGSAAVHVCRPRCVSFGLNLPFSMRPE